MPGNGRVAAQQEDSSVVRDHQSKVVPYFGLKFIATEQDGQQTSWIDQTTDEDILLPHATHWGRIQAKPNLKSLKVLRQYEDLLTGMEPYPIQLLAL